MPTGKRQQGVRLTPGLCEQFLRSSLRAVGVCRYQRLDGSIRVKRCRVQLIEKRFNIGAAPVLLQGLSNLRIRIDTGHLKNREYALYILVCCKVTAIAQRLDEQSPYF